MDEPTEFGQRETKFNFLLRIVELVVCTLCLIIFILLVCLFSLPTYIKIIILIVAALTTIIVFASLIIMIRLRKQQKTYHLQWLFIALASMICYVVCATLFIIAILGVPYWLLCLALGTAIVAAVVFLLDFIFNLRNILKLRKKNMRLNQVMPVNSVAVQQSEENLEPNNKMYGTIECSVIIGDQLACNQQVKWSSNQASSPTAKLIYVQPCNSSVINKICPACKKINCDQCFRKEENEAVIKPILEPQREAKSTQFPEDDENICPLCNFKAVKVCKSAYVQTSEEHVLSEAILKPILGNINTRHVHSAESAENTSPANNKLIQSFPATPRKKSGRLMTCPKCRKRSIFKAKIKKTHFCPVCHQRCTNKLTCTECYYDVPELSAEDELGKSTAMQTDEMPPSEDSRENSSKCPRFKKENNICAQIKKPVEYKICSPKVLTVDEITQVSSEEFKENLFKVNFKEDKVTQASLSDFIAETTAKQNVCCVCKNAERPKITKCEIETQTLPNEFMDESPKYFPTPRGRIKSEEYKATNVSSRELLDEMQLLLLGKSTEKIYENKAYGDQHSFAGTMDDESTQVSYRDFLLEEALSPKEHKFDKDKLTQVSSSDFVQKERRPCGAPECKHPICSRQHEPDKLVLFNEMIQTEEPPNSPAGKVCLSCTVAEGPVTDLFRQRACQTTQSLENTQLGPNSVASGNERTRQDGRKQMLIEKKVIPQDQELPNDLPECIDPKCTCIINEKEILVCTYCESLHNNSLLQSSKNIHPFRQHNNIDIIHKYDCKCNLSKCICCKEHEKDKEIGTSGKMDDPICCSTLNADLFNRGRVQESVENKNIFSNQIEIQKLSTQTRNTDEMKTERSYKKDSEDDEHKNKFMEVSEKNENEVNEDDYASSTCTSETLSNDLENKYSTTTDMKMFYKKEREDMAYYLANKHMECYSTPSPEPLRNVTVFTLQKKIEILEVESKEASDAEKIEEYDDVGDEYKENMKSVWDELAGKHALYQDRLRKDFESNINLNDDATHLHAGSIETLENTPLEMENIYSRMIKSLLERQTQKENSLIFLEKLNCGCNSDAESSQHHTDCSARIEEEETCKGSPIFQFQFPKFDIETREHITVNKEHVNIANDDNVLLNIKDANADKISSDILLISDNVSLSTITEEMSGTPSDLISISKESEPSKEQLFEKHEEQIDLNKTYCLKIVTPIDDQQEHLKKKCNESYVPSIPYKLQQDNKDKDAENASRNIIYSAKCKNASPKICSARSERCPRKSIGSFEPFMFSQTYGSTKTSFTASDNESVVDCSAHQDNIKTLQSTAGSSVSSNLQEDCIYSPILEVVQSQSLPMTSRTSLPINEETQQVFYCRHSIPCTPKKLRWHDADTHTLMDMSAIKSGRNTFRKESDYDEGDETPTMILIKNLHPEKYESDGNRDNEFCVNAKIVPPLLIANITPELSESEDSRPISCSSHLSTRTLQTIDNYNLECSSSLKKKNPKYVHLQEMKKSKKSTLGMKSQPLSTRVHPIVEKSISRRHEAKLNVQPTVRERRISAPQKFCQRKKSSSPKMVKMKSSTARAFRQKSSALSPCKSSEKRKASSRQSTAKKSRMNSEVVLPGGREHEPEHEHEHICHCEFYKKSRNNYCRIHGMQEALVTHRTTSYNFNPNADCSKTLSPTTTTTTTIVSSPKKRTMTSKLSTCSEMQKVSSSERPKTWTEKSKTCKENVRKLVKSDEASPKLDYNT